jgi:RNA polymerase sigma-70 factor (ECF subfamily)
MPTWRGELDHTGYEESGRTLRAVSAPGDVPEQAAARAQTRDVLNLLAELPEAQREAIALAFYGELSHTEIAAHLDLPHGTVKGRMHRGLQRCAPTSNDERPARRE